MKEFSIKEKSFIAKIAAFKLKGRRVAIVFGSTIHLHGASKEEFLANTQWLRHELKHVQQFEEHGYIPFLAKYMWHSIFHGYHNCCYEKEARDAENDETLLAQYRIKEKNSGKV
ncbi:MAG: DUF4157 domain-containing protein [Niabella sp.]